MIVIVIGVVVFLGVIVWVIWSIYNKTRKENISKERKEDEPEEWQKEFSDMQNAIKESNREREEAGQLIISKINHIRNQFCPNIEKVVMAFAKSIDRKYEELLFVEGSEGIIGYYIKENIHSSYPFSIYIQLRFDQITIESNSNNERYSLDLKNFSDVKFANELKNFYLRIHGLTK